MTHPDHRTADSTHHHPAPTTVDRRLGAGPAVRHGTQGDYREVAVVDGEPHSVRAELALGAAGPDGVDIRRSPSGPPPAAGPRPHHRPAARRRAVADAVRVPQQGVRRPSLRDDRAGPAAAGGAHGARRRRHDPDREPAGRRPGVRCAAPARRDHRRRDRQRAVERDAELPAPLRGRPRPARVRRTGVRGRAVPALGRRHLLEARRGGAGRAGRLPCLVRLPRPPRTAGARAGVVRRRRPDGAVAGLLRQPRAAQPGRRHRDAGAGRRARRLAQAGAPGCRGSTRTARWRPSRCVPRRSWPATPSTSPPTRTAARSAGASSSTPTSGRTAARTGTASPSGTGSTARRTTCTTCQGCGWSRWTPPAAPAAPTAAWTRTRRAGWRTGSPRCTAEVELPDGSHRRTGNEDRLVVLFSHHGVDTLAGAPAHAGPGRCPPARRP